MSILNTLLSSSGGLEYEAGAFTPTSNVSSRTVNFSKTHTKPPVIAVCFDVTQTAPTQNRTGLWVCGDVFQLAQTKINPRWAQSWTVNMAGFLFLWQAYVWGSYDSVSGAKRWQTELAYDYTDTEHASWSSCTRYYMNETRLNISKYAWGSDCDAVLEANHKYVWLAIWVPDGWTQPA